MTILTMPASPGFKTSKFGLVSNTQTFTSPLSGATQTRELAGARWTATFTLPPMKRDQAAAWQAFFVRLRGQAGRFYAYDPDARAPRGVATGAGPAVKGANQTGTTLVTDGWTPSTAGILKAGDYLAYDTTLGTRQLHMVVEDAASDETGTATLTVEPPIRVGPADAQALILSSPSCIMMLATPNVSWDADHNSVFGFTFEAVEAIAR